MKNLLKRLCQRRVKKSVEPRRSRNFRPSLERFEERQMLSASPMNWPLPAAGTDETPALLSTATPDTGNGITARYSPSDIRGAYGFTSSMTGSGQTVAIIVAYNVFDETAAGSPNHTLQNDLDVFSSQFGLPRTLITVDPAVAGYTANVDKTTLGRWTNEAALDIEYVHATAPGAKIVLVEASSGPGGLNDAAFTAAQIPGVSVVSMSFSESDSSSDRFYDGDFVTPINHTPVAFVAASGDVGGVLSYPATSPNVLSVGGTELGAGGGAYGLEIAWGGSGGGESPIETAPSGQAALTGSTHRATPDVSFEADPATGVKVYCTAGGGWTGGAGTSLGTPCWAGLIADANQARAVGGRPALDNVVQDIYGLPSTDFHDIINGSNGSHVAKAGYDEVTGRGTPIASLIVAGLNYAELAPGTTNIGVGGGIPRALSSSTAQSSPATKINPQLAITAIPTLPNLTTPLPVSEPTLHTLATDQALLSLYGPSDADAKVSFDSQLAASEAITNEPFEFTPTAFELLPAIGRRK